MCIDYFSFYLRERILAKSELSQNCIVRGFSAEKPHFLHKDRLLLYEQVWWNISLSLIINTKRELICEFILTNPPNS